MTTDSNDTVTNLLV